MSEIGRGLTRINDVNVIIRRGFARKFTDTFIFRLLFFVFFRRGLARFNAETHLYIHLAI